MARKLTDPNEVITVKERDLLPDGDAEAWYTLRPLTTEIHRSIVREHTKRVPNRATRAMEERIDWAAVTDDLIDYAVEAPWGGILDGAAPAACTRENKLRLDAPIKDAILERAGLNEIRGSKDEEREASFRKPARVP